MSDDIPPQLLEYIDKMPPAEAAAARLIVHVEACETCILSSNVAERMCAEGRGLYRKMREAEGPS